MFKSRSRGAEKTKTVNSRGGDKHGVVEISGSKGYMQIL